MKSTCQLWRAQGSPRFRCHSVSFLMATAIKGIELIDSLNTTDHRNAGKVGPPREGRFRTAFSLAHEINLRPYSLFRLLAVKMSWT